VTAGFRLFERLVVRELDLALRGAAARPAGRGGRSGPGNGLACFDLTADAGRLVADYSDRKRKKAALGCALINNPPVLFLDEAAGGSGPVPGLIRSALGPPGRHPWLDSAVLQSRHGNCGEGL